MDSNECPCCGSSQEERDQYAQDDVLSDLNLDTGLLTCPHCESSKCILCDPGDDVECPLCRIES